MKGRIAKFEGQNESAVASDSQNCWQDRPVEGCSEALSMLPGWAREKFEATQKEWTFGK